jgi:eukaryotic-like serine/threonine-protein kinase
MTEQSLSERSIFEAAIEKGSPEERAAYLDQVCGSNEGLRKEVEALLAAHDQLGSVHPVTTVEHPRPSEAPGTVIGPYKLLQQIGEGGMGTVFMAEQTQPVKRKVALKVIKSGMDSRQVIARFEAERQALAMMDHVNIARVLDAGTTDAGRPYFVMELVHGVPITKYCDDNQLTPRERLELFVPVCNAIQHAHQKGIIHRDIKPSNVMVTLYDGKPVPKVIDFGVAKATEQKLTERTLFTQYGTMVGTLEYMSPEQAEMSALGVDTRSDIYSLGVLLYELLTGSTPLTRKRFKDAAYGEILRIIKEEEPPKPSTRLSDSGEALASISAQRKTEPAKLSKLMRGELDWIVMKTLEKDRNRRYETANAFAADVQRYLNDETVQACPPSAWYRFRKYARRHRVGLATTGVITAMFLAALGGITASVGWAVRDRAAVAQHVARENADRMAKLEGRISQALDETQDEYERDRLPQAITAVKRAEGLLASDTGVSNEIRQRVEQWRAELTIVQRLDELSFFIDRDQSRKTDAAYSQVLLDIGIDVDEMPVEEAGKRIRSRLTWERLTEALDRWAGTRQEIAAAQNFQGTGIPSKVRLLQVARAADSDDLRSQARLAVEKWDLKAAERLAQLAEVSRLPASTLRQLAMVIYYGGEQSHREKAVQLLVIAQIQRPEDFQLSMACANYYEMMQPPKWNEAVQYWSVALAIRPDDARARKSLALCYVKQGRVGEAFACCRKAIELDPKLASAWSARGAVYSELRQWDKALADDSKAIELDPKLVTAWANRGIAYANLGQSDKALADDSKAIELDPKLAGAWSNRGNVYAHLGQSDKALADHSKAIELDPKFATAWSNRGVVYADLDQWDKALADYSKAIELDPKYAKAWFNRGNAYANLGQWDKALADYFKAIELDPKLVMALKNRSAVYCALGQWDKAVADLSRILELAPDNAEPHNDLAWFLATCPDAKVRDPGRAVELAKRAVALAPKEGTFWNTLGVAYYRAGDWKAAIEALNKSMDLSKGGDAFDFFFLAMAHWQQGDKDEAQKWHEKAVQWMQKNEEALKKDKMHDEELRRFRAEAEELLGVKEKQ